MNQDISPGTELTRQIVEETFAYSVDMRLIEIDGATLQAVLDRSVSDWSGGGHWLQIAGFAYRHDVEAGRALDPVLLGEGAPTPIDPARRYRVATTNYLLDASGNQDGYAMLSADMIVDSPRNGTKLETVVLDALAAAGDAGIAPVFEGRICSSDRPDQPCLVP